jgi:hypothetical protein
MSPIDGILIATGLLAALALWLGGGGDGPPDTGATAAFYDLL